MEKFAREQAHTLSLNQLEEILKDTGKPTINRLIFAETRSTEKKKRGIFPCWPGEVRAATDDKPRSVILFMAQFIAGNYNTICVEIPEPDIGVTIRFWNLPPMEEVMDAMPMADAKEVQ